jgi:sugar diacid utilization regulator
VAGNDPGRADAAAAALAVAEPFIRAWLVGERASVAADQASRTHLLAEIMTGQDAVRRDVVEAAVSLGWRMHDWHVGIHVLRDLGTGQPSTEIIIRQLQAQLARHGVATVDGVDRGDGWAVWVSRAAEPGPDDGRSILRICRVALAALPREWSLSAGIGRPYRGPKGLGETLAEARDAAYLARTRGYRPAAEHVDEAGVARLLAIWQQSEVVKSFAETALAPLRDKDESSLLATLRAYLEAGGSVVETAQVLGVHRNTVTARVHRLKERLGLNLDDPNQRLALQLACRAFTVQP